MMSHTVLRIGNLPAAALDAAHEFHAIWLEQIRARLRDEPDSLAIVLPRAPYDHADWRRAAARDLARMAAPTRVNVIGGDEAAAIDSTIGYLQRAPGVTGQYLTLDCVGAGDPLA
jgi:hypothetical protein